MSLSYYEEILTDVINHKMDDYEGYKKLESLPNHEIVDIVCRRMQSKGMTVRIQMGGNPIEAVVDILSHNKDYSWLEAMQMYYEHDLDCENYYDKNKIKELYV